MSDNDYPRPVDQDAPPQDGHDDPWLDAGTGEVMDADQPHCWRRFWAWWCRSRRSSSPAEAPQRDRRRSEGCPGRAMELGEPDRGCSPETVGSGSTSG